MYGRLKLSECQNLAHFINEAVLRIQGSNRILTELRFKINDYLQRVSPFDLTIDQNKHIPGGRRWCSEFLNGTVQFVTNANYANVHADGGAELWLDYSDIRAAHAIILRRVMLGIGYSEGKRDAWSQLMHYLTNKATSRLRVVELLRGVDIAPRTEYQVVKEFSKEFHDYMYKQPCVDLGEALASYQESLRLARAGLTDLQQEVILTDKGKDIMSLAPQVAPQVAPQAQTSVAKQFNFDKPAIADIKHVYGVPVYDITLNGITALLTQRQGEVERLKSLPHKPEVIKANIAKLKADIKSLLALANELFPVTE